MGNFGHPPLQWPKKALLFGDGGTRGGGGVNGKSSEEEVGESGEIEVIFQSFVEKWCPPQKKLVNKGIFVG